MKKKLLSAILMATMTVSLLAGCGEAAAPAPAAEPAATEEAAPAEEAPAAEAEAPAAEAPAGGGKIGVSMPTKDLQRWNQDGANMEEQFKAAGFEVDLQYASNDVQTQLSQVENMISSGCSVLVIAAIEGSSLGEALDMAKESGIPVIAYDRLLMDSDAVSYYATFDNYKVGTVQGTYVKDTLDLDNAAGPFNIEFTAGDPGDNNAGFFFNGAYDVLKPYIDEGKLVVPSGQTKFDDVATPTWGTDVAQSRAENILSSYYADGTELDAWLCSNDSTALGVENALAANYTGKYPIITGQDCDIENTKNMIAGKQSMSVFKDTRTLAAQVVKMVTQILNGETVDVNDTETYNNGVITVPSFLCEPVFADANNYKELLLDSGYYTEDQLK
ncbi:MAG: sugar-binding protein [Lachnospiraceae bacterium]|nr:sugar-binding protein [Lachnospiraceae bacterium]